MLGIRFGNLFVVPYNGDSIDVKHVIGEDWIVRVPRSWGDRWMDRAYEIQRAVETATCGNVPTPDAAA